MTKVQTLADARPFAKRLRRYNRDFGREFDRELRVIVGDVRDLQRAKAKGRSKLEAKAAKRVSSFASTGRAGTRLRPRDGFELGANFGAYRYAQFRWYSPDDDFFFAPVLENEAEIQQRILAFLIRFADSI